MKKMQCRNRANEKCERKAAARPSYNYRTLKFTYDVLLRDTLSLRLPVIDVGSKKGIKHELNKRD